MTEDQKIPSREEHRREIRRLWTRCILVAASIFVSTSILVVVLLLSGVDPVIVAAVSSTFFQIVVASYGLAFFVPAFMTSLRRMEIAVEMSRMSLEVGVETADSLKEFKEEIKPIVKDGQELVKDIRPVIGEVSTVVKEGKKVFEDVVKEVREGNGKLHGKIGDTLHKAVHEARNAVKGAEGDLEQLIWGKVEGFIGNVFSGEGEESGRRE
jgi:hypothetical protein